MVPNPGDPVDLLLRAGAPGRTRTGQAQAPVTGRDGQVTTLTKPVTHSIIDDIDDGDDRGGRLDSPAVGVACVGVVGRRGAYVAGSTRRCSGGSVSWLWHQQQHRAAAWRSLGCLCL